MPVVENGALVGIVSASDLLKIHLLDDNATALSSILVRQVMEERPVVLKDDASLRDAAEALSMGGYHALPVVGAERLLVGIVTTSDLITHLLRQIPRGDGSIISGSGAESDVASRARAQLLEKVRKSAELYLRSGHGEREHGMLVKHLAELQTL